MNNATGTLNNHFTCSIVRLIGALILVMQLTVLFGCGNQGAGTENAGQSATDSFSSPTEFLNAITQTAARNHDPEITTEPVKSANMNDLYLYQPIASDLDSDQLHWYLDRAPDGMMIDETSGLIGGNRIHAGNYTIKLRVEDGRGGSDSQIYSLNIFDGPVIDSTPPDFSYATYPYEYLIQASDPNDLELTFRVVEGSQEIELDEINPNMYSLDWHPQSPGKYKIKIQVSNTRGQSATQEFVLNVLPADGIAIMSEPLTEAYTTIAYKYHILADTAGRDKFVFSLTVSPSGMTIDPSGHINWVPTEAGDFPVQISVMSESGTVATQDFHIHVVSVESMGQLFTGIVNDIFLNMSNGDKPAAMKLMTLNAQKKFGPMLDIVMPDFADLSKNYSHLVKHSLELDMAEYMLKRNDGAGYSFMISFERENGVWKLDEM